jgi:hypothetical protein
MQDKDFLQGYEIRNLDLSPRMYKFFAVAAAINLIIIFVVGQTNMLARSACDSPFVNRICSVLDTVYFSSKILSTDAGYVVKEYEQTKIQDSDVVWVDQTNVEPGMTYPAGYFQIANRDELAMLQANPIEALPTPAPLLPPMLPPIARSNDDLLNRGPILPKRKDSVVEGELPDDPLADLDADKKPDNDQVADNSNTNTNPKPSPKTNPNDLSALPKIEINKQPLYDFVDGVVEKVNARKVDLRGQFRVVMNAYINDEGRLDIEKSRWLPEEEQGDPQMILVAKDAVEKVGDSGWLVYLSDQGIKNLRIVFYQDEDELAANIISVLPSINKARTVSSGLNFFKSIAVASHNNGIKKLKDDEILLLNSGKIFNERNILKIDFNLKKDVAQQIINTRLQEYQADKAKKRLENPSPTQPNSRLEKSNTKDRSGR